MNFDLEPKKSSQNDPTSSHLINRRHLDVSSGLDGQMEDMVNYQVGSKGNRLRELNMSSMMVSDKQAFYSKTFEDLINFTKTATHEWGRNEKSRRFTALGEFTVCVAWKGRFMISGSHVMRTITALYRLKNMGKPLMDRRRFEEGIYSDLRCLKTGVDALLEESNSELIKYLYKLNACRTHKRQKIYYWESVPFQSLLQNALERDNFCMPSLQLSSIPSLSKISSQQGLKVSSHGCDSEYDTDDIRYKNSKFSNFQTVGSSAINYHTRGYPKRSKNMFDQIVAMSNTASQNHARDIPGVQADNFCLEDTQVLIAGHLLGSLSQKKYCSLNDDARENLHVAVRDSERNFPVPSIQERR